MTNEQPTIYVGIDVLKDTLAVAISRGGVRDEVLSVGIYKNTSASVDRLLKKLSGQGRLYPFAMRQDRLDMAFIRRCVRSVPNAVSSHLRFSRCAPASG